MTNAKQCRISQNLVPSCPRTLWKAWGMIAAVAYPAMVKDVRIVDDIRPDSVLVLGLGYWASRTLLCAIEVGVFTALAAGPLDREALRQRLGLHERAAGDFLDALVGLRLLERCDAHYRNSPEADEYLDRNKPSYLGDFLIGSNNWLFANWHSLPQVLKTGRSQPGVKKGGDLFSITYNDPAALALFARRMSALVRPSAWALARRFPWEDYRTFIDVGTAEGAFPVEIARAHPHLTGSGFDRPPVRPMFEAYVRRHGLTGRLQFCAGDFVNEPVPSADVFVMGDILHEWNLETKHALLRKAHAALPPGGALIVYGQMTDDERRVNVAGLLMSLHTLIHTPDGFNYSAADCVGWMRAAGFDEVRREHLHGSFSMVVGIK